MRYEAKKIASSSFENWSTSSENWSTYLINQLRTMYESSERCDLEISCPEQTFLVHRLIMSASSDYVRKLDDEQKCITLPREISADTLKTIINFVYTGNTNFLKKDVENLLKAATFLTMPALVKLIEEENSFILPIEENEQSYDSPSINQCNDPLDLHFLLNDNESVEFGPEVSELVTHFVETIFEPKNQLNIDQATENTTTFPCTVCHKQFSTKLGLRQHILVHGPKNRFICDVCQKGFRTKDNMKRHILGVHMKAHLRSNFVCGICRKPFKFNWELKQHLVTHGPKDRYKCELCSKGFKLKDHLKRHVLGVHMRGILPAEYKCIHCQKQFFFKLELTQHLAVHDPKIQFRCESCGSCFRRKATLRKHTCTRSQPVTRERDLLRRNGKQ